MALTLRLHKSEERELENLMKEFNQKTSSGMIKFLINDYRKKLEKVELLNSDNISLSLEFRKLKEYVSIFINAENEKNSVLLDLSEMIK